MPDNISKYNKSLTPEKRTENARNAGKTPKNAKIKTIREIARMINDAPATAKAKASLAELGIQDENITNAALIAASVFRAAFEGDLKAVEKWEKYVGQYDNTREDLETKILKERLKAVENGNAAEKVELVISPRGTDENKPT